MSSDDKNIQHIFTIGFNGSIKNGIYIHPRNKDIVIYPCGSKVVLHNILEYSQKILQEESRMITATSISLSGKFIAAAYCPYSGFKALICLWNLETFTLHSKYESHRDEVHSLAFSSCEQFVFSLGGFEHDNGVICYSIIKSEIICGSNAKKSISGNATGMIIDSNHKKNVFITHGYNVLRLWYFDNKNLFYEDASFTKIKRNILSVQINEISSIIYCGTCAGDVMKFKYSIKNDDCFEVTTAFLGCYGKIIQKRNNLLDTAVEKYGLGVTAILLLRNNELIIGSGDGIIEHVKECEIKEYSLEKIQTPTLPLFLKIKSSNVGSKVTSIKILNEIMFVGLKENKILLINIKDFSRKVLIVSYMASVNDIAFPYDYSDVFATAGNNSIRIWRMDTFHQCLQITVKGSICYSVLFSVDGTSVISAWNDGCIRAHTPQTASFLYAIRGSHMDEAPVICTAADKIISGNSDGEIQAWQINLGKKPLSLAKLKQHKGKVLSVNAHTSGKLAASSSVEGMCVIWDILEYDAMFVIFTNTITKCVRFHPSEKVLITCGYDRQIKFWDTTNGDLLEQIEGSNSVSLEKIDTSSDGKYIVTADAGSFVKVWNYDTKKIVTIQLADLGSVNSVKFSPDNLRILTAESHGHIVIYKFLPENKI